MRIICPECGSQEITFGKDFIQYRYWQQETDGMTYWCDFEYGDDSEEVEDSTISATCRGCNHSWAISGSVDDYMDG